MGHFEDAACSTYAMFFMLDIMVAGAAAGVSEDDELDKDEDVFGGDKLSGGDGGDGRCGSTGEDLGGVSGNDESRDKSQDVDDSVADELFTQTR
jgi:hypothetical protein